MNINKQNFWNKVSFKGRDRCWVWKAALDSDGYGSFKYRKDNKRYSGGAHRISYSLCNPKVNIDGLCVLHTCDNPPCVNPRHLKLGTQLENIQDCISKNRQARGSSVGTSKLTPIQVLEIIRLYKQGKNKKFLADKFGVSPGAVHRILKGESWFWLTKELL